jgi:hypothetical protein
MTILQQGPKGFVLGTVARYGSVTGWEVEHRPAWIRETETGADAIEIQNNGDYSGMYRRVGRNGYTIEEVA